MDRAMQCNERLVLRKAETKKGDEEMEREGNDRQRPAREKGVERVL